MRYFLAFSYNMHDSSVSIADERRVLLVLEAERYYGEKKKRTDHAEMEHLIDVALKHCGIGIDDVDGVACTAYLNDHLPEEKRNVEFTDAHPVEVLGKRFDAVVLNHHLAHAAMVHAYPEERDVVIDALDGGGDFGDCHRIYRCTDGKIEQLPNRPIHDLSSSRFYDVISRYLYKSLMCEGKLMALAALAEPKPDNVEFVRDNVRGFFDRPVEESFALLKSRHPVNGSVRCETAFELAAAAQRVFEDLRIQSVAELPQDAPCVLLTGGGTLNIIANTRVKESIGERRLLVPPCCDDTGQSLGALLYYCRERQGLTVKADMPFLGYSDRIDEPPLDASHVQPELVDHLTKGGIVFLHRGQSEIGPRALGNRSILALPTRRSYDVINHVIKQREFYRPLAPLVPRDDVSTWFDWDGESNYMLYAAQARENTRLQAPGICHYDNTARLQTVESTDRFLYALLKQVGESTGCPILINTSLNPKGVPILSRLEQTQKFAHEMRDLNVRVFSGFLNH